MHIQDGCDVIISEQSKSQNVFAKQLDQIKPLMSRSSLQFTGNTGNGGTS